MEGVLAITFIFGGGTLLLLSFSPVGRAFAARLQGRTPGGEELTRRLQHLEQSVQRELEGLRDQLTEIEERLDFAERLLAQRRSSAEALPGPRETP